MRGVLPAGAGAIWVNPHPEEARSTRVRFDLIVIGTGTGLDVANGAVEAGLRVALVEKDSAGGTCLNRGCIPSKLLLHSADVAHTLSRAHEFGIHPKGWDVDFPAIVKRVTEYVDGDSARIREGLRASTNPRYFEGTARFVGPKEIEVAGMRLVADRFLIATGARPRIPPIPGLREAPYITSTEALRLTALPKSMVILGGGFIAAEMAHFYGSLGTAITIVQRHAVLLNRDDREIAEAFTSATRARGFRVLTESEAVHVETTPLGVAVDVRRCDGAIERVAAEKLLVAVGLAQNSDSLDLPASGVATDEAGRIVTDPFLETTAPGIFALGDAVGRFNLKHAANHEADYALHNLTKPDDKIAVDYLAMPRAVFGSPQVATVGETEEALRARRANYLVGRWRHRDVAMGHAMEDGEGFVKLLVDAESGRILGCHILGSEAATLLHQVLSVMRIEATVEALQRTIYIHPALSEVVQRAAASLRPPDEALS